LTNERYSQRCVPRPREKAPSVWEGPIMPGPNREIHATRNRRADLRFSGGLLLSALPSGQSKPIRGMPRGMPSPLTANVLCIWWIPGVPLPSLLREMTPGPEQPPWAVKSRSRPVLDQRDRPRPAHALQRPLPAHRRTGRLRYLPSSL